MKGTPFDWNVVVVGSWNLAILTPDGIARRLFCLSPGTPVEVQVPIVHKAAIRVIYSNITVEPSENGIVVTPTTPTLEGLAEAAKITSRAIESLPETPVSAAGINFRYRFDTIPDEVQQTLRSALDDRLVEGNRRVAARVQKRAITWEQAHLNIEVQENEEMKGLLVFNFHRQSTVGPELCQWLGQVRQMADTVKELLASTFKVQIRESDDE